MSAYAHGCNCYSRPNGPLRYVYNGLMTASAEVQRHVIQNCWAQDGFGILVRRIFFDGITFTIAFHPIRTHGALKSPLWLPFIDNRRGIVTR
jgi:hypothetical protein